MLKGYVCNIPVRVRNEDGSLSDGPAGIPIRIKANTPNGYASTVRTDMNGIASFEEVPNGKYNAYFEQSEDGAGLPLYGLREKFFQIDFTSSEGFIFKSESGGGFVIETTLVEGYVKQ